MRACFSLTVILSMFCFLPSGLTQEDLTLSQAKQMFSEADKNLNILYQKAKTDLSEWEFGKLQEEQRVWLESRDERAEMAAHFNGQAEEGREKENVEYWRALAQFTDTRAVIVEAWIKADSFTKSWEGMWIDGNGGRMAIIEGGDDTIRFRIDVVRGPTYHLGSIGGVAFAKNQTARFSTRIDDMSDETWITMVKRGKKIEVIGENTMYYHGARAYFDGDYIRVSEDLTEEERNEVENPPEY